MGTEGDIEHDLDLDDVKVEFHPGSKRRTIITHYQDFSRARVALRNPPEEEPYRPFRTRTDFEFARTMMEAAVNAKHINALINLIRSVSEGAQFTFSGYTDLMNTWKGASDILTPVRHP